MNEVTRLTGGRVALDADRAERIDLHIRRGRVLPFDRVPPITREIDVSGCLLLPGLINAHDHLEFNLFPRLGKGPWKNAREWAAEIHRPNASPVKEHRRVPRAVRLMWGALRNLLSGVTTVAHHNPFEALFSRATFPVRVVRRFGWAHSLDFSPDIAALRKKTPPDWPFIVHVAEGIDDRARQELTTLDELGLLDSQSVLVHATAATPQQLARVRKAGACVVWCPGSNLFTLRKTLSAKAVRSLPRIALGTDSALTAEGDLIDEMRVAREAGGLTARDVYGLVTAAPAQAFRLASGEGGIRKNGLADILAIEDNGRPPAEALTDALPQLVLKGGRAMLISERFHRKAALDQSGMHWLEREGRGRYLLRANIPELFKSATRFIGPELRLAGKRVAQ